MREIKTSQKGVDYAPPQTLKTKKRVYSQALLMKIPHDHAAWLIDAANCRQLNKKAVEHRKTLLSNLYHVFDNGLQLLILESAEKDQCTDSKNGMSG